MNCQPFRLLLILRTKLEGSNCADVLLPEPIFRLLSVQIRKSFPYVVQVFPNELMNSNLYDWRDIREMTKDIIDPQSIVIQGQYQSSTKVSKYVPSGANVEMVMTSAHLRHLLMAIIQLNTLQAICPPRVLAAVQFDLSFEQCKPNTPQTKVVF